MGSGFAAAPLRTCATCEHFDRTDYPESPNGLCLAVLPPWTEAMSPFERYLHETSSDESCSMHKPRELTQCAGCVHQWQPFGEPEGCLHFEGRDHGIAATVLAALLFQNAKRAPCPAFAEIKAGPESYRSENLPRPPR